MEQNSLSNIQAKIFDFALFELIYSQRDTFQPLWTTDSWVKFLIWLTLNCGLSGDKESLELFANSIGRDLTIRMRRRFFERRIEEFAIHIIADPAESNVLVMPLTRGSNLNDDLIFQSLDKVSLREMVVSDTSLLETVDSIVLIPWKSIDHDS